MATTFRDFQKVNNATFRLLPTTVQVLDQAKINEVQQYLTWFGDNPSLWDYPSDTIAVNNSTANGRSAVYDYGRSFFHKHALVRIVTTVGSTPTATYAIQGSSDNSTWSNVNYADYLSPSTLVNTNITITTAGTFIKLVPAGQSFRYLSVLVSADTNVTHTIDITPLG